MMMDRFSHFGTTKRRIGTVVSVASLVAVAALMAACSGGDKKGGTQVAAKVNKEEISVHQINYVLQRQPGLKPEQAAAATKAVLEGLIDQELAVQESREQKLDRDPNVVMSIEAAKREILARAYADKIANAVSKPTDEDISAYYSSKPALFAQRRVYSLQEFSIEASGEAATKVASLVQASKSGDDLVKQLNAAGVKFAQRTVTQPAENLPLAMIDKIGGLSDGQSLTQASPGGITALFVLGTKAQPVNIEQAKPAIEQFLLNERKRKVVTDEVKRLRTAAKVSYEGQFAQAGSAAASQ